MFQKPSEKELTLCPHVEFVLKDDNAHCLYCGKKMPFEPYGRLMRRIEWGGQVIDTQRRVIAALESQIKDADKEIIFLKRFTLINIIGWLLTAVIGIIVITFTTLING